MNYDALVSALQSTTELESTESMIQFPVAIDIAEERLTRDLDSNGLTVFTTVNLVAGSAFLVRPTEARIVLAMHKISDEGEFSPLYLRTPEFIRQYWPIRTSTSTPFFYAPQGFDFLVAPTPTSALPVEVAYVARPTAISASNQTNWFTKYASNALYYAAMVEMCKWMKNPSAMQMWEAEYQTELKSLLRELARNRRDNQAANQSPTEGDNFQGVRS